MPKYYFSIAEMGEEEDGTICDVHFEVDTPYDVEDQLLMDFLVQQMPLLEGKLRPITREEYIEHTEEDINDV